MNNIFLINFGVGIYFLTRFRNQWEVSWQVCRKNRWCNHGSDNRNLYSTKRTYKVFYKGQKVCTRRVTGDNGSWSMGGYKLCSAHQNSAKPAPECQIYHYAKGDSSSDLRQNQSQTCQGIFKLRIRLPLTRNPRSPLQTIFIQAAILAVKVRHVFTFNMCQAFLNVHLKMNGREDLILRLSKPIAEILLELDPTYKNFRERTEPC